ncbi:hypothetical protein G8C92_28305 [Paenibacillus donghaensis]|uniref:hypothetical protein n=1 Tax=Paenibacillus donghaensis TaxID=414771 RepID=UPI001883FFF8|nr:hypothetical protein [Paenibacillus donghaensis]MBE9917907.1 hypothetical protein [Paenibacillus donghaensis]
MKYKVLPFSDVKHLLPADSWAYARNERNGGEFETESVILFEGDTRLENLNLDKPFDEDGIFLILVDGNLVVDSFIYNEETDGATGLIVKGDLQAGNMVVGGQEIYVTGNLQVSELFWGDYNHGDLTVAGNASALLFMDTEEYHVSINGEQHFALRISNWDEYGNWEDLDEDLLQEVFIEDCLIKSDEEVMMFREKMLEYFKSGRSVTIPDKVKTVGQVDIPYLFDNTDISMENLFRLANSILMPNEAIESEGLKYEFWLEDDFYRVFRSAAPSQYRAVYFQQDPYAVIVETQENERDENILSRVVRRSNKPDIRLNFRWRCTEGEDTEWHAFDDRSPEQVLLLLQNGWPALLTKVSCFEYYRRFAHPERIRELLSLPLAEPYDDFYDDDRSGFWCGSVYIAFRQPGVVHEGVEQSPCFLVAREKGEDMEIFHFVIKEEGDGTEVVQILYQAENGYEHKARLLWDEEKLKTACRLFRMAERKLLSLNRSLLAGEAPHEAESFAIEYWEQKGYL